MIKMVNVNFSKYLIVAFLAVVFFFPVHSFGQTLADKIDQLLSEKYGSETPGGVFLVAKKGEILYEKAFGLANLELDVQMNPKNVFEIGSMTKQFTAISILMLVESGILHLDDEITKFIPDYPTHGNKVTIHHLLTHTSGIKNFTSMKTLNDIAEQDLTPIALIEFFKNEPMDFLPGEKFQYNNSGYVILGYIVEQISGKSYGDFVQEYIFDKLEMKASLYANHHQIIKERAYGYQQKETYVQKRHISYSLPYASGSLMSTVGDLLKWQQALKQNTLIKPETTAKAFTNYSLNNGEPINYGYGWHIVSNNDIKSYEHGGSIFGFKSMAVYLPDFDVYVVGLTNCDCNSPTKIVKQIAEMTLQP